MRGAGRAAVVVIVTLALPAAARADVAPAAPPPNAAPAPYSPPPPLQNYVPPPAPQGAPPPAPGAPPAYGYYAPSPTVYPPPPPPQALYAYEADSKSQGLALLLEWFIPGVGSIYADHVQGALVTWGATIGGAAMLIYAIENPRTVFDTTTGGTRRQYDGGLLAGGVILLLGGRIYGLIDSWTSAGDYNDVLAVRLGLRQATLLVAPLPTTRGLAWGPSLSFRF